MSLIFIYSFFDKTTPKTWLASLLELKYLVLYGQRIWIVSRQYWYKVSISTCRVLFYLHKTYIFNLCQKKNTNLFLILYIYNIYIYLNGEQEHIALTESYIDIQMNSGHISLPYLGDTYLQLSVFPPAIQKHFWIVLYTHI